MTEYYLKMLNLFYLSNISLEAGESRKKQFLTWIRLKNRETYGRDIRDLPNKSKTKY